MLCPDFLGPNTCTLHYLEVVGVGVVMEHVPTDQEGVRRVRLKY